MSTHANTDTLIKPQISPKLDIKEPSKYKVIYINDETTTVDFVIQSLISVFDFDEPEATAITQKIHEDGSAIVAVLPYEIAEQKGIEVTMLARSHGFPLAIKLEQE